MAIHCRAVKNSLRGTLTVIPHHKKATPLGSYDLSPVGYLLAPARDEDLVLTVIPHHKKATPLGSYDLSPVGYLPAPARDEDLVLTVVPH
jgi:hypothetical protein